MARKVRKDYKQAFERLVEKIRFESALWREESEIDLNDSLQFRHEGMHSLCEHLLEMAESYEAECKGWVNANGRVSLHLIHKDTGRCEYDLDCNVGEMPERVWCEDMHTVSGNGFYVSSQADHIYQVHMNGTYGVPLTGVSLSDGFYWTNDSGCMVDGPEVWEARYTDTALALC